MHPMADPSSEPAQLALELSLQDHADFATFVAGENRAAVAYLGELAATRMGAAVWLFGPPSSGKSHLLQATCRAGAGPGLRTIYLPLAQWRELRLEVLHGLESLDLLALDDVDAVAGVAEWEEALFGLWNACQSSGSNLVLAAQRPPRESGYILPDLGSRLSGSVVYRLLALGEAGRLEALLRHASQRGLALDESTGRYLLTRIRRDMREVCEWLERLDRASLKEQRRITGFGAAARRRNLRISTSSRHATPR